jgi:membrane fusion protein, copper/silver efflux system
MNTRRQVVLSLVLVGLSVGAVGLYSAVGTPETAAVASSAHAGHGIPNGGAETGGPVHLTAEEARRIGVTYARVERRTLTREVRAVGIVTYDETTLATVNPKIEGWVERLYVNFTGAPIRRGEPLMEVYSPMLVSAQEELILAWRLVDEAGAGGSERAASNARELLESARRRLRYWDIGEAEIERIERAGTPRRTLTLTAPATGLVVEKNVVQGGRIMPGMDLYRIADLSRVWVEVDVYEKDLSLLRSGQHGNISFDSYPDREFEGLVTYLYPTLNVQARTGRVRLELANPGGTLKPGMYARVRLHLGAPAEALVVPRTAVLQTGQRAVVFVRGADGMLTPREVRVGLAVGNDLEILSGLQVEEQVVSSASFLIDAESNLGASLEAMQGMSGASSSEQGESHVPDPPARTSR